MKTLTLLRTHRVLFFSVILLLTGIQMIDLLMFDVDKHAFLERYQLYILSQNTTSAAFIYFLVKALIASI